MKRHRSRWFGAASVWILRAVVVGSILLSTECSPAYPACRYDSHCIVAKQRCMDGLCGQCRRDVDCKEGERCSDRTCVKKSSYCREQKDCAKGKRCVDHACVDPDCAKVGDCPAGLICREYFCVPDTAHLKRPVFPIDRGATAGSSRDLPPPE
jgi:hypothetical protein